MDARAATLQALDTLAEIATKLGGLGGPWGYGILGAGALLRLTAKRMRESDEELDDVLARIRAPRNLDLPWKAADPLEDTQPAKPSAKKQE